MGSAVTHSRGCRQRPPLRQLLTLSALLGAGATAIAAGGDAGQAGQAEKQATHGTAVAPLIRRCRRRCRAGRRSSRCTGNMGQHH
jgi:hypothetical protein